MKLKHLEIIQRKLFEYAAEALLSIANIFDKPVQNIVHVQGM
jgi:hypothetical protein